LHYCSFNSQQKFERSEVFKSTADLGRCRNVAALHEFQFMHFFPFCCSPITIGGKLFKQKFGLGQSFPTFFYSRSTTPLII